MNVSSRCSEASRFAMKRMLQKSGRPDQPSRSGLPASHCLPDSVSKSKSPRRGDCRVMLVSCGRSCIERRRIGTPVSHYALASSQYLAQCDTGATPSLHLRQGFLPGKFRAVGYVAAEKRALARVDRFRVGDRVESKGGAEVSRPRKNRRCSRRADSSGLPSLVSGFEG